jgi:hypothetical protein
VGIHSLGNIWTGFQSYLHHHYTQALVGGLLIPDWLQRELVMIVSLIEEYWGTWRVNDAIQSQEILVVKSLHWKISIVTTALNRQSLFLRVGLPLSTFLNYLVMPIPRTDSLMVGWIHFI